MDHLAGGIDLEGRHVGLRARVFPGELPGLLMDSRCDDLMGDEVRAGEEEGREQRNRHDADQEVGERQTQGQPADDGPERADERDDAERHAGDDRQQNADEAGAAGRVVGGFHQEGGQHADDEQREPDSDSFRCFRELHAGWIVRASRTRFSEAPISVNMAVLVTFFRQAALLLPSAFLLGVLLFLLTHGHQDPGFGAYPFFEQWAGGALVSSSPEGRFVQQALLFFVPTYLIALLFILFVALAEKGLLGASKRTGRSSFRAVFAGIFAGLFFVATGVLVWVGDRFAARLAPGSLVAPLLVAFAPYGAAAVALVPAAILAAPVAALRKADPT